MFSFHQQYSAQEIVELIGRGSGKQTDLLSVNGEVLAAHVRRKSHPEAPRRIYAGNTAPLRKLAHSAADGGARIPMFVKEPRAKKYDFHGYFDVLEFDDSEDTIEAAQNMSGRPNLSGVLVCQPAGDVRSGLLDGRSSWPDWIASVLSSATMVTQRIMKGRPDVKDEELGTFLADIALADGEAKISEILTGAEDQDKTAEEIKSLLNIDGAKVMSCNDGTVKVDMDRLYKVFDLRG